MNRTVILLLAMLLLNAGAVIELREEARVRFTELSRLYAERDSLNTEWGRLLLEQGALGEPRRVETLARRELGMVNPDPSKVVMLYVGGRR